MAITFMVHVAEIKQGNNLLIPTTSGKFSCRLVILAGVSNEIRFLPLALQ